ncbi:MAG: hypothetical protein LBR64_05005 [Dysgonamonadaceae bacterium]|jgi:hypothetical protein|nr:hypothetical protein [Dysgonamonadaceae bacterium]
MEKLLDNIFLLVIIISFLVSGFKKVKEWLADSAGDSPANQPAETDGEPEFFPGIPRQAMKPAAQPAAKQPVKPVAQPKPARKETQFAGHIPVQEPVLEDDIRAVAVEEYSGFPIDFSDENELRKAVIYSEIMGKKEF